MADSSDDDDFGQKLPPLHIYLKRVLDKYPEGGQIIKELVQNADDAEAKKVIFLFDKSEHSKDHLWTSELGQFQGPALYAYNDAVFKPPDWYNIQHPEQSGKADELTKVGRFGLGFISVYHLTDLPCILSGKTIGFLDPREKHFNYNPHTNTKYKGRRGKKWKLNAELLSKFRGQFSPFLVDLFHCAESSFVNGHFEGTIFRFPLRIEASEISKNVYNDDHRVLDLFRSFETDSELSLLFLKHVQSIEVYERGHVHEQPRQLFKVHITPADCPNLTIQRQDFLTRVPDRRDFHTVTCVNIEKWTGASSCISRFITVNAIKTEQTSGQLQQLISDDDLKLVPWMGIAIQVGILGDSVGISRSDGRVFCFLPLPGSEQTGLPVHVHGYFGLGDNRRGIKWPDRESQHDKNAIWNKLLATEVFPDVYRKVVLASIEKSKLPSGPVKPDDVYGAWPRKESIKKEWSEGVKTFLQMLRNDAIFFTNQNGGCWMKANEVYVDTPKNPLLTKILQRKGYAVSHLPNHVTASLRWAGVVYREITPGVVRSCIRNDPLQYLSRPEKLKLIDYVTSDIQSDLTNICLVPLQDGTFTMFSQTSPTVYIASYQNPSVLIPNAEAKFAASDMPTVLGSSKVISYTQLKNLGVDDIFPLLQQTLPTTWIRGTDVKVQWTPGCNKHPPIQWLTEMWNWLTKNQVSLEKFQSIPLIPMMNNRFLAKLLENRIIFRKQRLRYSKACLTEGICLFLEKVGAIVLRDDLPAYVTNNRNLDKFIQAPNPEGVLNILIAHRQKVNIEKCVTEMTARVKNELRGLFGQLRKVTREQKEMIKLLPLFLSNDQSFMPARQGVSVVPCSFFGIPVKRLKKCRITITDSSDDNLATLLGIHKESAVELLSSNILPAVAERFYTVDESMTIMSWVLANQEYDFLVTTLKFIPTADDKLVSPSELFEPSDHLVRLFSSQTMFPIRPYSEGKLLAHLKRIGLKNASHVTPSDVLNVATEVSRGQENGQANVERAKMLINHINLFPHLLSMNVSSNRITKPLYKFLEDLNWVPCEGSSPSRYPVSAGWYGNNNTLYSPRKVGLIESALLQGSVVPLISMPGIKQEILNVFNWSSQLDPRNHQKVEKVVLQLKNVASNFVYPAEITAVSNAVHDIYGFLSRASDLHLNHLFPTIIASQPWVWHGAGFTTPDKMALTAGTLSIDLKPYLFTVPDSIKQHDDFLTRMEVQQTFQESALNVVLSHIQAKHAGEHVCNETSIKSDVELLHSILRYIPTLSDFDSQTSDLLVPCRALGTSDSCLRMMEASRCLYVDEERLMKQILDDNFEKEFDKGIIHKSISNDLAQRLGVQPLSHVLAPSEAINYGYELAGPHETPTNAIKRNLDMYKKGVDIFKELIQNADDAGATEVKFLIDWRRNEETANNLLCDRMKACHGPSLWAYNNARFSKEDITNICSIAAQSKKHKLDKVGRFGLGFTSVYHLTDVPSVVSGPYVLICDPRTTHLGSRIQPGQPGIKLDLTNPRHHFTLKSYPNQFQPYNGIFGCNLATSTDGFDHTLIRLPLRTRDEANEQRNQLAEGVFDSKDAVNPLIESLKKASSTLLLFTQNVIHVSVYELDCKNPSEMNTLMSVSLERMQQMPRSISGQEGDVKTERNLLAATSACKEDISLPIPETTMIVKVTQETYASNKTKRKCSQFIISSCMVQGEILELAETDDGRRAGVLPCGGVAAELVTDKGGLTPKPVDGRAFSYLPLEVSTGLPFHVNGNFLLQPNRRQLWSEPSSSKGEFEARWNLCFIESVLSRALFNLLQDLRTLQIKNVVDARDFQSLWPRRSQCTSDFCSFVKVFYHTLCRDGNAPAVIFNGSQWVTVQDCFFTEWNQSDSEDLKSSVIALLRKKLYPQSWVELDPDVALSINQVGAKVYFDSNTFSASRFLQEVFFDMLQEEAIESSHRDNIVLHLLDLRLGERKVTEYDDSLKNTDCIPYSPDEDDLSSPDRLVNPFTLIGSLYGENDNLRFPYGKEYRKEVRLLSLKDLGMACDDLPWDDVCERAESISMNDGYDQKIKNLLRLIADKLGRQDTPTVEQKERIQNAKFLPVLSKPKNYPSVWCKSDLELMSVVSLYESRHMLLLGSVQPLLDEGRLGSEALNQNVKAFLGFVEKEVKVVDVISQLDILIKETEKCTQQTSSMGQTIYAFLQDAFCRDDVTDQNIDRLCSLKFILCEGEFRACQQFAFEYDGKSRPYLFEVPTDLSRFETLLRRCGVKQHFEVRDYLQVLHLLKAEFRDMTLTEIAVRTAVAMTSEVVTLCRHHQADGMQDIDIYEEMYVLDDQCILQKPSDLTYHDLWWVDKSAKEVYTNVSLTHNAAKTIGIKTTRQKKIDGCSSSNGFESEFGQMEKLTDRLSNILRSYPHVSDVFKELLQNADDAGATEIHFVYDPRKHESQKVISRDWAGLQDLPALCVYNDKSFTEADIKGIQKVGVGGKREDISTTGRFGIGFNAVYHLTDCPSFLSNKDTLCVFDPLLKYTERADATCPGRRYKINEDFRQNFPDMLCGYLEGEFNGLEGTMFRFPLRDKSSEISEEYFFPAKVEKLLDEFQTVSEEALLFLNNIKKITISRINDATNKLEVKYSTNATFSDRDRKKRAKLSEHVKLFRKNPHEIIPSMSQVYNLVIQDSSKGKEKWLVSQVLGFEGVAGIKGSEDRLPRGGAAALISGKRVESGQRRQYRAYCVLPLPIHTHLPVHVNGMFELDSSRRDLSKGDDYGMEGNDVDDDDKLILKWNRQLIEGVIAPAYAKLLMEAGRKIPLKGNDKSTIRKLFSFYDDLFPKALQNLHKEWRLVAKATLQYISQRNLDVLPVVCQKGKETQVTWHHVNTATSLAYFDDMSLKDKPQVEAPAERETKKTTPRSTILRTFLLKIGFKLLESSVQLCRAFQSFEVLTEFVSPQAVVKYLSCYPLVDHSSSVPLTDSAFQDMHIFSTLFEYCLEGITQPSDLIGLPLRLTNDDKVGVFTTSDGLYITSHCKLLPNMKQLFLHRNLVHLCFDWLYKKKSEDETYTSGIFKKFTISELGVHLGNYLPGDWQGCTHHIEWTPHENGHPPVSWITNLWEFICSEAEENSQTCLQPLQDWPVFPTTSMKLVPSAMSKTVVFLHDFCDVPFRQKVTKVLQTLGVPELDTKCLPLTFPNLKELLMSYLALPVKPDSVVDVIKFMLDTDSAIGNLSLAETDTLIKYLQEGCDSFSEENVQTIKMLKIFKLLDGNMTNIQSYEHYHTIEGYSLLLVEAETWMKHMNCVFLHPSRHLNLIHCKLGISPITHGEVYLKFILPSFNLLTLKSKVSHLENIEDKVLYFSSADVKESIIRRLSQISFIPDREGNFRTAEYFFDPEKAIFKAMIDPNQLLPESMGMVKDFLSKLGLQTEITRELFDKFCRTIESKAKTETSSTKREELCKISKLLTGELQINQILRHESFLRGIAEIKFIPSIPIKQELIDIHPAVSDGHELHTFIAYRGSLPEKYAELVWSVAKLLPKWSIPSHYIQTERKVSMHDCLGIQNKVVIDKALSHIQQVCCRMVEKNAIQKEDTLPSKVRNTFKKVMSSILKYLQDNITEHGKELQRRLRHIALCLVDDGQVLIRADQMIFDMMDQEEKSLRPYLYKVPRELSAFDDLHELLGAEKKCTFDQLAGVLSTIKTECKDASLDPNESNSVRSAVAALFTILGDTKGKCKITVAELYLPSSNNLLRKASNLYYADPDIMGQMKLASTDKEFVIPLKQCGFDVNDELGLIELLPESLRPKNLGNEMHENVHEDNEDCPAGQDCPYLEHIKRMVNSVEMTRVLLRLLQHQFDKAPDAGETKSAKRLQKLSNICCKTELKLGLYDSNGALVTSRPKSVPAYFNKENMTIYLEHVDPHAKIRSLTFSLIAKCCGALINDLLDPKHLVVLQNALDCDNPNGMNEVLCKSDIPEYDTGPRGSHKKGQYRLGTVVPSDITHLLDQDPYNRLYEGEIVGYERPLEDVFRADENTVSGSAEFLSMESELSSDEDTEIVFAKIVEQIGESDASNKLSKQYKIDIGLKEPITVKVTALFKFLRPQEKPDLTVVPFTGDPEAELPSTPSDEPLPDIFENFRDKIKEEIKEAFNLPEAERKRAIKRLYRKWHPDKNPGRETLANEAFKFLKAEIDRHENGSHYQEKYSQWENDVRRDREYARDYQKKYRDHFQRHGNRERENDSTGFVPPSFSKETPDPRSARLWFRQAEEHYRVAQLNENLPSHVQWIAFQIHQAAEMALKAAQYSLDGHPDMSSNDLTSLARTVCQHKDVTSREVLTLVCDLIRLGCDFSKPRQPQKRSSMTSGQAYQDFKISNALQLCRELLNLVRDIIGIKVL